MALRDGQRLDVGNVVVDVLHTAELEIYPGHQAGSACGAGISGKPASTLGFEKRANPMLTMSRDAFVEALVAGIPVPPADMDAILRFNLGLAG